MQKKFVNLHKMWEISLCNFPVSGDFVCIFIPDVDILYQVKQLGIGFQFLEDYINLIVFSY